MTNIDKSQESGILTNDYPVPYRIYGWTDQEIWLHFAPIKYLHQMEISVLGISSFYYDI